ncbi:MAG: hypothetical protein HYX34_15995 [Actinobacteria bacterium]|nr:hypothetical protein [Actinomycetota bacterium]
MGPTPGHSHRAQDAGRAARVSKVAIVVLGISVPVAAWWLVGPLDSSLEELRIPANPREYLDYMVRPPVVDPGVERAVGIAGLVLGAASLAVVVRALRRHVLHRGWSAVVVYVVLSGIALGFGARVITAGVIGANIGGGMLMLVLPPALIGGLVLTVVRFLVERGRRPPVPSGSP